MALNEGVRFLDRTTPPHIVTLILLSGIPAMTMNMFLPSLPAMASYFETDYALMQLSLSLYLGMNAVLQIIIGPISDRFGRRPVLLYTMAIFALASLGCILSTSIEVFLVFRMIQAVCVSGIALSRAVVRDTLPADSAASKIGYVTMGMALVPMLAPTLGGFLQTAFGWHANFWLMMILGVCLIALIWFDLVETATNRSASFAAQVRDYPELFRSRRFWGYAFTAMFAAGAFFAYLGGAPWVGAEVYGLEPTLLGLCLGTPAVGYMVGNGLSGRFSARVGIQRMTLIGTIVTAIGMTLSFVIFLIGLGSVVTFFGFMVTVGLGNGLVIPNATTGMLSVRPHLAGTASGVGGAIMIAGGATLSAISGSLLTTQNAAMVLVAIMMCSALCSVLAIAYVISRERGLENG